jgi:hypothetical protein
MGLSDSLAGDHAPRRERDLVRTGRAKLVGNLEAAANLEHRDDVADRDTMRRATIAIVSSGRKDRVRKLAAICVLICVL